MGSGQTLQRGDLSNEKTKAVPNEKGFVSDPEDKTVYREASKIINDFSEIAPNIKELNRILAAHPEIRRWKPRVNRLSIHLGDWQVFIDKQQEASPQDDPNEIEQRKNEIRRRKEK